MQFPSRDVAASLSSRFDGHADLHDVLLVGVLLGIVEAELVGRTIVGLKTAGRQPVTRIRNRKPGIPLMTRGPKRIGDVLPELMSRRGYARVESTAIYHQAWSQAAGPLTARYTRLGSLRRGTLEVVVSTKLSG